MIKIPFQGVAQNDWTDMMISSRFRPTVVGVSTKISEQVDQNFVFFVQQKEGYTLSMSKFISRGCHFKAFLETLMHGN